MSFFNRNRNASSFAAVKEKLAISMAGGLLGNKEAAKELSTMVDFESMTDNAVAIFAGAERNIDNAFQEAGVTEWLMSVVGTDKQEHPLVQAAMEQMVHAAMAIGDTDMYHTSFANPKKADGETVVIGSEQSFDMEGFDDFDFSKFAIDSVMSAGLTMATSPFGQTFFKPVVIPPSQSGKDIEVTLPMVYSRTYRTGTGVPFNFVQTSLVKAALDHKILEANSTDIVPVADAGNAAYLVAASVTPNRTVKVGNIEVATRPLKYGVDVDLLGVSQNAAIVATGVQTEMDTLDPMVSVGVQVATLTIGGIVDVVKFDIGRMSGALLNNMAEGHIGDKSTSFEGAIWFSELDTVLDGALASTLGIEAKLGLTVGDKWRVKVQYRLHATTKVTESEMRVDLAEVKFGDVYTGANYETKMDTAAAEYTAFITDVAIAGVGYEPVARRSNSNMRDLGTIVDTGKTYRFRLACPMEAPISSVKPITVMGGGVSMDVLSATKRLRNLGTAASTILATETRLIATQGMEGSTGTVGELLVTPTYLADDLDVSSAVATLASAEGLLDLQAVITNSITMHANQLILNSGYRTALELYTGNANAFQVDIVTDPLIANLIMTSGDGRTLGNGRPFSTTAIDDVRFRNKIYITISRTDVSGVDPLNFGAHLSAASLIFKAGTTRAGAVASETHLVPRERFVNLCPILGMIDVTGLENYFTK